jgi:hypothetical protein
VAGGLEQVVRCRDRARRVILPGEPGNEERDGLVADELVDEPVPPIDDSRGLPVEPGEKLSELSGL